MPCKSGSPRGASPSGLKGRRPCKDFLKGKCSEPTCDLWHPPVCLNYKSESGCKYGDRCHFRHTEVDGQQSKKSKKGWWKRSVALLKESRQLECVSQYCLQKKSILREIGKLGSNHAVKFSKSTMRHAKILERKGPSQGIAQNCVPQERIPWAPKFEERTQDEILRLERCASGVAWNLAKDVYKLKKESKDTFCSLAEAWVMPAPSSTILAERQFVTDSGASMHTMSKKDLSSGELDTPKRSKTSITVVTANGVVETSEEAQVYVNDFHFFVTVQLLEDSCRIVPKQALQRTRFHL